MWHSLNCTVEPLLRPHSKSDWSGRKTGVVVYEGIYYFITCLLRQTRIYIPTVSTTLRTAFGVHCRTRENAATYPLQHLQARPRCIGLRWPRFQTTMLSFSWINLPTISISCFIKPRSDNNVQILVATFTLLANTTTFVSFPLYPSRAIASASCRPPS